jgi:6-phosphogluconolactonase
VDAKTGKLQSIGQFPTGEIPRSFNLGPNNKWMVAAGQKSNDLHIYERNSRTGKLTKLRQQPTGQGPSWVQFIPILKAKNK